MEEIRPPKTCHRGGRSWEQMREEPKHEQVVHTISDDIRHGGLTWFMPGGFCADPDGGMEEGHDSSTVLPLPASEPTLSILEKEREEREKGKKHVGV